MLALWCLTQTPTHILVKVAPVTVIAERASIALPFCWRGDKPPDINCVFCLHSPLNQADLQDFSSFCDMLGINQRSWLEEQLATNTVGRPICLSVCVCVCVYVCVPSLHLLDLFLDLA